MGTCTPWWPTTHTTISCVKHRTPPSKAAPDDSRYSRQVADPIFARIEQAGHDNTRSYGYKYDRLNRLTGAGYGTLATDQDDQVLLENEPPRYLVWGTALAGLRGGSQAEAAFAVALHKLAICLRLGTLSAVARPAERSERATADTVGRRPACGRAPRRLSPKIRGTKPPTRNSEEPPFYPPPTIANSLLRRRRIKVSLTGQLHPRDLAGDRKGVVMRLSKSRWPLYAPATAAAALLIVFYFADWAVGYRVAEWMLLENILLVIPFAQLALFVWLCFQALSRIPEDRLGAVLASATALTLLLASGLGLQHPARRAGKQMLDSEICMAELGRECYDFLSEEPRAGSVPTSGFLSEQELAEYPQMRRLRGHVWRSPPGFVLIKHSRQSWYRLTFDEEQEEWFLEWLTAQSKVERVLVSLE